MEWSGFMYKVGKDYESKVLYLTDEDLRVMKQEGVDKAKYTSQQWARIRKLMKKVD